MSEPDHDHGAGTHIRGGLLPPRALLLSLAAQAPLVAWTWPPEPAKPAVAAGLLAVAAGVALNIWATRLFARSGVGVCPFSPVPALVAEGPYRFSRNPMYLGLVLLSGSVPLMTGVPANLWAPASLAVWLHFRFVLREEEFLRERIGMPYLAYASRSPRWLGLPGPPGVTGSVRA